MIRFPRHVQRVVLVLAVCAASVLAAARAKPKAPLPDFSKASWIWATKRAVTDGVFGCYLRRTLDLPAKPKTATVLVTADNGYDLYVNGSLVGGDAGFDAAYWKSVEKFDVADLLVAGKNALAVKGQNMGGPAGLLLAARIDLPDGTTVTVHSDATWRHWLLPETGWATAEHDDSKWKPVAVIHPNGAMPWGKVTYPGPPSPRHDRRASMGKLVEAGPDFPWPQGVVFLRGRVPDSSTRSPQSIWRIRGSRAFLEHDAPAPAVLGRMLCTLVPAKPDGTLSVLHDAGAGIIGSPTTSHDGQTLYFCMAPAGEKFLHIYRIGADGTGLEALTSGPFQDYDPAVLPDGRIAFSSTRIGSREEYHGNLASSLFVMHADGSDIRPLTYHIVADREPTVTAHGTIAFVRSDNFLERAKVETQIHHVRPDGSGGTVVLGADRSAIGYGRDRAAEHNSRWLRQYGAGSPAPLPDGRVAALTNYGLVASGLGASGAGSPDRIAAGVQAFDVAAMPDGRLLATVAGQGMLAVIDPATGDSVPIYAAPTYDLHSVAFLGPRPVPPRVADATRLADERRLDKTGTLVCQSVFYTKQDAADLSRVKAIRIYEGRPLAIRSARHPYDHIGVESVELGTVPLAADGSFHVRVPADRALAMQAVDAEGRPVVNELSWIYVRPGERRTCVGCHYHRPGTPSLLQPTTASLPPVDLLGQGTAHRYRGNNAANGGVLNLQFDRFREVANINLHSTPAPAQAMAGKPLPPGRAADVQRLCAELAAPDAAARVAAARRLALFRSREAVPALAKALGDPEADVRIAATLALAACGNRDAVPPLVRALGDEHPLAARGAQIALEHLTAHAPPLAEWRSWQARNPWPDVEARLIARLEGDDPLDVQNAAEALGHVGHDAARKALRDYVAAHPEAELRLLMAAVRALGHLRDPQAVPLLAQMIEENARANPGRPPHLHELGWLQQPVYRAATAAEALGWIATPEAQKAILAALPKLLDFWKYTFWVGDHSWLMGCHSSPIHYRMIEALDAMGASDVQAVVPHILRSVPLDTDRGLLLDCDGYETLVARVVQRAGLAADVLETCLAVLGDPAAKPVESLKAAVTASPPASSCRPLCPEARAAQIASVVCLDGRHGARLRAAFDRYRPTPQSRKRSWTCFFLARAIGRTADRALAPSLRAALTDDATETSLGLEDPPNVFIYKGMTPFYRAAAAYALGRLADRASAPVLLDAVANLDNALDVRHAAAQALALLADPATLPRLRKLADDYPEVATRRWLLTAVKATESARTATALRR